VELVAGLDLVGNLLRVSNVDVALSLLDQRDNIAHPQHPLSHALGVERLQTVQFFRYTHELQRFAGDVAYRQGCTTSGITVELGQDHTGQGQSVGESLGNIDRVLAL